MSHKGTGLGGTQIDREGILHALSSEAKGNVSPGTAVLVSPSLRGKLFDQVIHTCSNVSLPPTHRPHSHCFGFCPSSSLKVTHVLPS